jgi:hypothetical protein
MIRNIDAGGFTGFKIDFLGFGNRDILDEVMRKIDALVSRTGAAFTISWDVTEEFPRLGYFFGREYGSLHTSNRKPTFMAQPRVHHIAYTPRLVLRDAWHLAHYINLNQIEIPVQDVSALDPRICNASSYSHDYCAAMSVAGLPLFFQETHRLKDHARDQTRTVMQAWREHREAMARGYVFPIGDEPCDAAWTGFQLHDPANDAGYVLVFRELEAEATEQEIDLHFPNDNRTLWQDVLSGEVWTAEDGRSIRCRIASAPGFRWLRYKIGNT